MEIVRHPSRKTAIQPHEMGARPKMLFMQVREPAHYDFYHNPNGSYEAWPRLTRVRVDGGVAVYHPTEGRWMLSDYADDAWLDAATGNTGWRENVEDPRLSK